MFKFLSVSILVWTVSSQALATNISCQVSNQTAQIGQDGMPEVVGEKIKVPVIKISGATIPKPSKPILIDNQRVTAIYQQGSSYEPQTFLRMTLGDVATAVYDVKPALYVLQKGAITFQCVVKE